MTELESQPCSVAKVVLRISGKNLDPSDVTAKLGVHPSKAGVVGSESVWSLFCPAEDGQSISAALQFISRLVEPKLALVKSIQRNASVRIYCGFTAFSGSCKLRFSAEDLRLFVKLGIPLEVTVFLG